VATKCGRRIQPHINEGYTTDRLRKHVEDSLRNTGLDQLDLIQLHCPPSQVYQRDEIFGLFEELKKEGKIAAMGVSVERIDEAKAAIKYDIVSTIQLIFNVFRQLFRNETAMEPYYEIMIEKSRKKNIGEKEMEIQKIYAKQFLFSYIYKIVNYREKYKTSGKIYQGTRTSPKKIEPSFGGED
jgi:predicted oxidoreductase